jgi:hypothetical protein
MTAARIAPRKAAPPERRSSAGGDPARLVEHRTWLTASARQRLPTHSARPDTPGRPPTRASPVQSAIPTMPAAAKSP